MGGVNRYLAVARSTLTGRWVGRRSASSPRLRPLDLSPFEDALRDFEDDRVERVATLVRDASIVQLSRLMDSGRLTSQDLTLLCLSRIRAQDETLRSLLELNPHALVEAASADERRRAGVSPSPLCGIPLTLKDNIETAPPLHTTAGSVRLADHLADHDAPLVALLRDAGAVILGKANLSELAGARSSRAGFSAVGGQAMNPFGAQFSPGGSSSGSALPSGQGVLDLAVLRGADADAHAEAALGFRDRAAALLAETFDGTRTELLVSLSNRHSSVYATAGFPAVTVPAGMRSNGMPVGATFIGRPGEDGRLLSMAHAFERVTRLRREPIGAGRR